MLKYILSIFVAESSVSFGRWASLFTIATSCWSVVHVVRATHALPDGTALAGLAVFMTAPYAVNKAAAALNRPSADPSTVPNLNASATPHHTTTRLTLERDR